MNQEHKLNLRSLSHMVSMVLDIDSSPLAYNWGIESDNVDKPSSSRVTTFDQSTMASSKHKVIEQATMSLTGQQ